MYEEGDQAKINKEGFSLLDIKRYLERHGYKADGFRITLETLQELGVPAIVLITHNGFRHFVVVKGVTDRKVLVGDPTFGSKVIARPEFEQMWNKMVFLVRSRKDIATKHFNSKEEWLITGSAPLSAASTLIQPLGILSLHLSEHLGL
jgi:predicted double-glycine peptidase